MSEPGARHIAIASDHRGYALKGYLQARFPGHHWLDLGPHHTDSVDYPEYANAVSDHIIEDDLTDIGILICGSGYGMCMAANRRYGIRASVCRTAEDARITRMHNAANVLCIGADYANDLKELEYMFSVFMSQGSELSERHLRRQFMLDKLHTE